MCTIYDGNFDDPMEQGPASTVLMVFNDVIVRAAVDFRMPLIDLRAICSDPADYANPIEPSAAGGRKIAQVIARVVQAHDFAGSPTSIYV